jgi:hypothetical protein
MKHMMYIVAIAAVLGLGTTAPSLAMGKAPPQQDQASQQQQDTQNSLAPIRQLSGENANNLNKQLDSVMPPDNN